MEKLISRKMDVMVEMNFIEGVERRTQKINVQGQILGQVSMYVKFGGREIELQS